MRIYGNLMNRIAETVKPIVPENGMGATVIYYSDRKAATVIAVSDNKKTITVREDRAIRTDGNERSESQSYRYEPFLGGQTHVATLRKNGTYVIRGSAAKNGTIVRIGARDEYYDYGF